MISGAHYYNRANSLLIAPARKCRAFVFRTGNVCGYLLNLSESQGLQFCNITLCLIWVLDPAAGELLFHSIPRVGEDGNSRGYTGVNKIGCFKHSGPSGFSGHDNNVRGLDLVIGNKRPSGSPKYRMTNRWHSKADNNKQREN